MWIKLKILFLFLCSIGLSSTLLFASCENTSAGGGGTGTGGGAGTGSGGSGGGSGTGIPTPTGELKAFPEAEGFGAHASGGRGGQVIYVTNLNASGPGSLRAALEIEGPRTILFKVSGLIDTAAEIIYGDVTIAGQTSPGGVIVRGLICDEVYEPVGDCDNLIVRHLRSRPRDFEGFPSPNYLLEDALRLDGVTNAIYDHLSLANALDETAQVSQSSNITIQNSILAELVNPDHVDLGGMLINYSTAALPMDNLSIHHNLWNRLGGRMPEISCESPDCAGRYIDIELSNNMAWDPRIAIWYNPSIEPGGGGPDFHLNLNWVNNYWAAPASFTHGMILDNVLSESENNLFFSGNQMNLYPALSDEELAWCCNDFSTNGSNVTTPLATMLTARHDFPGITYTPTTGLQQYMIDNVGAFPRDPMDRRLVGYLESGTFSGAAIDVDQGDGWATDAAPAAPIDTDNDGLPDAWETDHGLDPNAANPNGIDLSSDADNGIWGCTAGYTNLECYLNELAYLRVTTGS